MKQSKGPIKQGELDGLCSIYSIINAIDIAVCGLNREQREWIFCYLFDEFFKFYGYKYGFNLKNKSNITPGQIITDGHETKAFNFLVGKFRNQNVEELIDYCGRDLFGDKIDKIMNLNIRRYANGSVNSDASIIEDFKYHLNNHLNSSILIGFTNEKKGISHWSTVDGITKFRVQLHDSEALKYIPINKISFCTSQKKEILNSDYVIYKSSINFLH